ncbi:MAG TPA: sulfite exporter TauE/SafE family protein [Candidatus Angelobacter sp.]|nr:sulfite exporter TauE/SafE family protein [Candidatus Angelobacter sp.]
MEVAIGFVIAVLVGLTGVGGGSFTTPMLVLVCGISGAEAVGTALVFSTVIKTLAAPFFVASKKVHFPYLRRMLLGAVPGLLAGTYLLANMRSNSNPVVLMLIGATLIVSAALTLFFARRQPGSRRDSSPWLPWLTLPIGLETGFSSAGAGALGTLLLFNCSDLTAAQVVGTDILFGIALAGAGSIFHFGLGSVSAPLLKGLLLGGVPGVLLGCAFTAKVPSAKLKVLTTVITLFLGIQLLWTGARLFARTRVPQNVSESSVR